MLTDPVTAYVAATNLEAQLIKVLLQEAGIEAHVSEDHSTAGLWMFARLPEVHRPQIWVSKGELDRARLLLTDFEARAVEREKLSQAATEASGSTIDIVCEECHQKASFTVSQLGTIQDCPHCGAYVDVEGTEQTDEYWHGQQPDHEGVADEDDEAAD
jgi:hypothetical protein